MATPTKWGTEFLVNTNTTGDHSNPVVTALADGRFVVAWGDNGMTGPDQDGYAVRGQIFNADGSKAGAEFQLNADPLDFNGSQSEPTLTALADGGFMAAWTDPSGAFAGEPGYGVVGQIFHPDGTLSGNSFLLNTTTSGVQRKAALAQLADGHIAATWIDDSMSADDASNEAIRGQLFNAD